MCVCVCVCVCLVLSSGNLAQTLLSIPSKVYARILDERTRRMTEIMYVLEATGGFRKRRSCRDKLFTVRQLSEK